MIRKLAVRRYAVAVPVAAPDVLEMIAKEADEVVCVQSPGSFRDVGQFCEDFSRTSDEEFLRFFNGHRGAG